MKRFVIACAAVALGTTAVPAASPKVDTAIKAIQAAEADSARMEAFCDLIDLMDDAEDKAEPAAAEAAADKPDPAFVKQEDALLTALGSDFESAWDVGYDLEAESADAKEYDAAVDALADKCQ